MTYKQQQIIFNDIGKNISLNIGFNLCLLLEKIRLLFFFDNYLRYNYNALIKIIKSIKNTKLFSIYYRHSNNKGDIVKIRETVFLNIIKNKKSNYKKIRIIICLKKNTSVLKIINKDILHKDFGNLQSLMCATKFDSDYIKKNNSKLVQLRYYIKYKDLDDVFMYQLCIKEGKLKHAIKKDLEKYVTFCRKFKCTIYHKIMKRKSYYLFSRYLFTKKKQIYI